MTFSKTQIKSLKKVSIKKKTGYEPALAESLGWIAINERLYDAVKQDGTKVEFKKQSADQWFDLVKLSECTAKDRQIEILWFMHTAGQVDRVYRCTYGELIKRLGITKKQLVATRALSLLCKAFKIQIKIPVRKKFISTLPLIWER